VDDERASRGRRAPGAPRPGGRTRVAESDAVRFALWFNAWTAGAVSLDAARDGIVADDAAHDVVGLPDRDEPVPLILALGLLRAERATAAGLALPVAGDPVGLAGPASFNTEALEVGEAVLLEGADLGLVPARAGAGVVWRCLPATSRRQVPSLPEADTDLRATLPRVADALADLEVARWRPEVADALLGLRSGDPLLLPPGADPRLARTVDLADRCRHIVDLALEDDGGALNAFEVAERRKPLVRLDAAARRALVAACSHPWAPAGATAYPRKD
jgi:hypothetical protein